MKEKPLWQEPSRNITRSEIDMTTDVVAGTLVALTFTAALGLYTLGIAFPWVLGKIFPDYVESHEPLVMILWPFVIFSAYLLGTFTWQLVL